MRPLAMVRENYHAFESVRKKRPEPPCAALLEAISRRAPEASRTKNPRVVQTRGFFVDMSGCLFAADLEFLGSLGLGSGLGRLGGLGGRGGFGSLGAL